MARVVGRGEVKAVEAMEAAVMEAGSAVVRVEAVMEGEAKVAAMAVGVRGGGGDGGGDGGGGDGRRWG